MPLRKRASKYRTYEELIRPNNIKGFVTDDYRLTTLYLVLENFAAINNVSDSPQYAQTSVTNTELTFFNEML